MSYLEDACNFYASHIRDLEKETYDKDDTIKSIQDSVADVHGLITRKHEQHLENVLRTKVKPPIKGEITKGKISWRGLRLIQCQKGRNFYSWVEQRGEMVGDVFSFGCEISPR